MELEDKFAKGERSFLNQDLQLLWGLLGHKEVHFHNIPRERERIITC